MRALVFVAAALAAALAGCSSAPTATSPSAPAAQPSAAPTPASPAAPTAAAPTAAPSAAPSPPIPEAAPTLTGPLAFTATLLRTGIEPARMDAVPGTTITFLNADALTHSVVSDDGSFVGSGPIAPGQSFAFTFQRGGDYPFHCRYHPEMTGLVVVR